MFGVYTIQKYTITFSLFEQKQQVILLIYLYFMRCITNILTEIKDNILATANDNIAKRLKRGYWLNVYSYINLVSSSHGVPSESLQHAWSIFLVSASRSWRHVFLSRPWKFQARDCLVVLDAGLRRVWHIANISEGYFL